MSQLITCGDAGLFTDQTVSGEHLTEFGLFNLTGRIARDVHKDDLARTFVSGHTKAEAVDIFLGALNALLDLNNRGGNFAQPLVRQADDRDVADIRTCTDKVLDLDG